MARGGVETAVVVEMATAAVATAAAAGPGRGLQYKCPPQRLYSTREGSRAQSIGVHSMGCQYTRVRTWYGVHIVYSSRAHAIVCASYAHRVRIVCEGVGGLKPGRSTRWGCYGGASVAGRVDGFCACVERPLCARDLRDAHHAFVLICHGDVGRGDGVPPAVACVYMHTVPYMHPMV